MPPITLNGDTGIQTPMYNGTITANAVTPSVNMKNRIINGDMTIDQRNAGASVTNNAAMFVYPVDRMAIYGSVSSKFTGQQNAGSVTPPTGFVNYLGITSSSAYTVGSGENFFIKHLIEGFNVADLGWGTANAQTITLSFWVRSSLTGTFGGALQNSAANRSYPFSYTISAANTWEYKTITIAGDTTGTWLITNGIGISLIIGLGVGSTLSGTAGAWAGSNFASATGATSVVGTNGATFYITGVQLEKGSNATSFDYRPYTTELQLCQRYYQKSYNVSTVAGTATDVGAIENGVGASVPTTNSIEGSTTFKVSMRTAPTVTAYDRAGNSGRAARVNPGVSSTNNQTVNIVFLGENGFAIEGTGVSAASFIYHYQATAEL